MNAKNRLPTEKEMNDLNDIDAISGIQDAWADVNKHDAIRGHKAQGTQSSSDITLHNHVTVNVDKNGNVSPVSPQTISVPKGSGSRVSGSSSAPLY
jgi:hypothetical protein